MSRLDEYQFSSQSTPHPSSRRGDDGQSGIWQRLLQGSCLDPRGAHLHIHLFDSGQDDRHGFWMNRADDPVRRCGQKAKQLVLTFHRLRLRAAPPIPRRLKSSEGK